MYKIVLLELLAPATNAKAAIFHSVSNATPPTAALNAHLRIMHSFIMDSAILTAQLGHSMTIIQDFALAVPALVKHAQLHHIVPLAVLITSITKVPA